MKKLVFSNLKLGTYKIKELSTIPNHVISTEEYTVETDGTYSRVTYTDVAGNCYKNVEMNVSELASSNDNVYLKVKNNGTETTEVRVNMYDAQKSGNNQSTNISATQDGENVRTDLEWGGSFFELAPNQESELVIFFILIYNSTM